MDVVTLLKVVARGVVDQSIKCAEVHAKCIDPPALTSGMLRKYGMHSEHTILNFWRSLDRLLSRGGRVSIYRSRHMDFCLLLLHRMEEVYYAQDIDMYVDPLDCDTHQCTSAPHTHTLKVYIEGRYGDRTEISLNVVHVLSIAIAREPSFRKCLEDFAENPLSIPKLLKISRCIHDMMKKNRGVLEKILEKVPDDLHSFLNLSPLLRRIVKSV